MSLNAMAGMAAEQEQCVKIQEVGTMVAEHTVVLLERFVAAETEIFEYLLSAESVIEAFLAMGISSHVHDSMRVGH
jgi:hypothetical protein